MSGMTRFLNEPAWDRQAARELPPCVYDELSELVAVHPTALVHEAFLRPIGPAGAIPGVTDRGAQRADRTVGDDVGGAPLPGPDDVGRRTLPRTPRACRPGQGGTDAH